jgi:16S rRNA (cytosine967-C5)-methyltransferase
LSATQRDLLGLAADIVDRAGKICYSTCSLQRQENRDQVKSFLSARPDFSLEYENLTFPSPGPADCDGGYFAVIVKN